MPLKGIHSDVRARQPNISDTVNGSELFLRKNKDRLAPKQNDDLTKKSGDLRGEYDDIYNRSDDWLREAVDKLNNMEMDEVQRVRSFLITITIFYIFIVHIPPMKVFKAIKNYPALPGYQFQCSQYSRKHMQLTWVAMYYFLNKDCTHEELCKEPLCLL